MSNSPNPISCLQEQLNGSQYSRVTEKVPYLFSYNEGFSTTILSQEILKGAQLLLKGLNIGSFAIVLPRENQNGENPICFQAASLHPMLIQDYLITGGGREREEKEELANTAKLTAQFHLARVEI